MYCIYSNQWPNEKWLLAKFLCDFMRFSLGFVWFWGFHGLLCDYCSVDPHASKKGNIPCSGAFCPFSVLSDFQKVCKSWQSCKRVIYQVPDATREYVNFIQESDVWSFGMVAYVSLELMFLLREKIQTIITRISLQDHCCFMKWKTRWVLLWQ